MKELFEQTMLKALRLRLHYFMDNLEAVRENPSCKNTHGLSTSLRRILTCDRIINELLGKDLLNKKVSQPVKRLRKILTKTRDAQEMPLRFKEISGPENRWRKVGFKLEKHEKQTVKKLVAAAGKFREDLLENAFSRKRLKRICKETPPIDPLNYIRQLLNSVFELLPKAVENDDDHALHQLRIRFKYFRYSVEALAPVLGLSEKELDWLREFQTAMGDAHDWLVLSEFVNDETAGKSKYASCRDIIEDKLKTHNIAARKFIRDNHAILREKFAER